MGKVGRPKSKEPKHHMISFRMNDDDYAKLKQYAQRSDMTISEFISLAIKERCAMDAR